MLSISRLAWMLLVLALVGALAGLFGPHERVWGVDLGATGVAVFGFTLWTGAWLFARHPDEIFPPEWSIAERRAWAGLLFLTLVFVNFAEVHGEPGSSRFAARFDPRIALAAFHLDPLRAADRLGSRREYRFEGRRRSWWNSTNGTCACSARQTAPGIGRLRSSSSQSRCCLLTCLQRIWRGGCRR